ncbi:MAG: DoxX family protein [Planctomycetota bacterium]
MKNKTVIDIAWLLNRITLGMLFVFAGVRKAIPKDDGSVIDALSGFANFVAANAPLPRPLGLFYGYALPPVEVIAGLMLVIGFYSRVAATLIALMLLSFMIEMGIAWWPAEGPAFDPNVILFTLALLLAVAGGGRFVVNRRSSKPA